MPRGCGFLPITESPSAGTVKNRYGQGLTAVTGRERADQVLAVQQGQQAAEPCASNELAVENQIETEPLAARVAGERRAGIAHDPAPLVVVDLASACMVSNFSGFIPIGTRKGAITRSRFSSTFWGWPTSRSCRGM